MKRQTEPTAQPHSRNQLTLFMTCIFAITAGLNVANVYYAQPLLETMAVDFNIPLNDAGLIVTLTQVGYGLGLVLLVPLGELIDRRRLILGQNTLLIIALFAVAAAPTKTLLFICLAAMGLLSVTVQILVAFAATLALPAQRGKAVGMVTSGVVIGILAARIVSGILADIGGWRAVYATSAILTAVMVGILLRILPHDQISERPESYIKTLISIPVLFLRNQILLVHGMLALFAFAAFSTFWTALALPLSSDPFGYSHTQIGLFGLIGMAGALAATGAGQLADRGLGQQTISISLTLLLLSWSMIYALPYAFPVFLIGIIVLDLAVQAVHVTNQSIIFRLFPEARNRLVSGYMLFYSVGSALGGITSTITYSYAGWGSVAVLGAIFSAAALSVWKISLAHKSNAREIH
ncbi:MFS transporter [Microvirga sp. W0021]|uniref:MFS transporter n=1 Tax=Hohaiivirga grylli TaxID=3133970 RepID=A0ABV0BJU8_9HYPH